MGIYGFWASIFVLPKAVCRQVDTICRNFLWGGNEEYKRGPPISWKSCCAPKQGGGLGLKDIEAWNKALIFKHIRAIIQRSNSLWVTWIYTHIIKDAQWLEVQTKPGMSWVVSKLIKVTADVVDKGVCITNICSTKQAYLVFYQPPPKVEWYSFPWSKFNNPKHAFISWLIAWRRIPVAERLSSHMSVSPICSLCMLEVESIEHAVMGCNHAARVWCEVKHRLKLPASISNMQHILDITCSNFLPKVQRAVVTAVITAMFYYNWLARNEFIFHAIVPDPRRTLSNCISAVKNRMESISTRNQRMAVWTSYIDL